MADTDVADTSNDSGIFTAQLRECEKRQGYSLDPQQEILVRTIVTSKASVVARACAGSGKTSTLTTAIRLCVERGMRALFLTFTREGRKQICEKYTRLLPPPPPSSLATEAAQDQVATSDAAATLSELNKDNPCVRTFHSLAGSLIDMRNAEQKAAIAAGEVAAELPTAAADKLDEWSLDPFERSLRDCRTWLRGQKPLARDDPRYRDIVLLDEVQDTSRDQWDLSNLICRWMPGCRLVMVGDLDQTIFLHAGATSMPLVNPERFFTDRTWQRCFLTTNYRSQNPKIPPFLTRFIRLHDPTAKRIRANPALVATEEDPADPQTPVLFGAASCKQAVEYLSRVIRQERSRTPPRGIWLLCRTASLSNRFQALLMHALHNLKGSGVVQHILEKDAAICIDTCHRSKGGQQDTVIVVGTEESYFPIGNACGPHLQEERNVLYVACSRAIHRLHLLVIETRNPVSRFLGHSPEVWNARYRIPQSEPDEEHTEAGQDVDILRLRSDQTNGLRFCDETCLDPPWELQNHLELRNAAGRTDADLLAKVCEECSVVITRQDLARPHYDEDDNDENMLLPTAQTWLFQQDDAADLGELSREEQNERDVDLVLLQKLRRTMVEKMVQWVVCAQSGRPFRDDDVEQMVLMPFLKRALLSDSNNSGKFGTFESLLACVEKDASTPAAAAKRKVAQLRKQVGGIAKNMGWSIFQWEAYLRSRFGSTTQVCRGYREYADNWDVGMNHMHGLDIRKSLRVLRSAKMVEEGPGVRPIIAALLWVAIARQSFNGVAICTAVRRFVLSLGPWVEQYVALWPRVCEYVNNALLQRIGEPLWGNTGEGEGEEGEYDEYPSIVDATAIADEVHDVTVAILKRQEKPSDGNKEEEEAPVAMEISNSVKEDDSSALPSSAAAVESLHSIEEMEKLLPSAIKLNDRGDLFWEQAWIHVKSDDHCVPETALTAILQMAVRQLASTPATAQYTGRRAEIWCPMNNSRYRIVFASGDDDEAATVKAARCVRLLLSQYIEQRLPGLGFVPDRLVVHRNEEEEEEPLQQHIQKQQQLAADNKRCSSSNSSSREATTTADEPPSKRPKQASIATFFSAPGK